MSQFSEHLKVLVVGGGSIGTRHLQNLRTLGVRHAAVVEPVAARHEKLCQTGAEGCYVTLEDGLASRPDIVFITSPSHLHVEQALAAAKQGCHLFIEKPLSQTNDGLPELAAQIEGRNLISLVGCNMRFHPGPAKAKELLDHRSIGRILFARLHAGFYLPGWRPTQDYRKSYSSNATMGGGCILDCIHEIDLARWFLGDVHEVFSIAEHLSSLELDVEDVAFLLCRHQGGTFSEIHLDYVQRTYERGCQIVGELGSIFWDFREKTVRHYSAATEQWTSFPQPPAWQVNDMYMQEIQHFLQCVERGTATVFPVAQAVHVMHIALAAKASARDRQFVSTRAFES